MDRKKLYLILAIILCLSEFIPIVQAPSITVSPIDSQDDAFITGIGAYFGDTPFLFLRDATQNIIIGTRFRNLAIPQGSKINNATLFVRSIYDYPSANNITVTIAGDDADDSEFFNDSSSFTRTFTTAFTVWNISDVNGNNLHNVSVTAIVQEIVDRIGWTSGNSLSLVFFTDQGTPRREFSSVDNNPANVAFLNITYGETPGPPSDQADPPYNDTGEWTWTLNDTYRGVDIWVVENDGVNRSGVPGAPNAVNWAQLNLTQLTELDSGAALTVLNATQVSINNLQAQQINTLFNDTGPANIDHFFVRGAINISSVTNNLGAGSDQVMTVVSISTATPVGGGGLREGNVGDWVGVTIILSADDVRWLMRMEERSGALDDFAATTSGFFDETTNERIWFEFQMKDVGAQNWIRMELYNSPNFTQPFYNDIHVTTQAAGPFRYPQISSSLDFGLSTINTGEIYTFITPIEFDTVVFLGLPNGTLVDNTPLDEDEDPEDIIDILLGGAQPEDPQADEYTLDKFRWKLLVLSVGMIMLLGAPIGGVAFGADIQTWVKILFIMFFGIGILWQIKFM